MIITELILQTNHLPDTEHFYRNQLELSLIQKSEHSISFLVGTSILTFETIDTEDHPVYHFAFNVPANKLEEAIQWLSEKVNLIPITDHSYLTRFENWNAEAIYFYDTHQNILEFIARADLQNDTPEEFSSKHILNINEVGIVADQPLVQAREIIAQVHTDYFSKGPKREDFVAVGTEQGLFVISNPERNWYPTKNKAQKHRVKTKLMVEDIAFELEFN